MALEALFSPTRDSAILESRDLTEYGAKRLIMGEPRIIAPREYQLYTPQLTNQHIAGDGFCDYRNMQVPHQNVLYDTLEITHIAVDRNHRGKRLGAQLMQYVIDQAQLEGKQFSVHLPIGCSRLVQSLCCQHEILLYGDETDFGFLVLFNNNPVPIPDITEFYAVPV